MLSIYIEEIWNSFCQLLLDATLSWFIMLYEIVIYTF